jgi:hypothetical protein
MLLSLLVEVVEVLKPGPLYALFLPLLLPISFNILTQVVTL